MLLMTYMDFLKKLYAVSTRNPRFEKNAGPTGHRWTDGPTDRWTDPNIEMHGRI